MVSWAGASVRVGAPAPPVVGVGCGIWSKRRVASSRGRCAAGGERRGDGADAMPAGASWSWRRQYLAGVRGKVGRQASGSARSGAQLLRDPGGRRRKAPCASNRARKVRSPGVRRRKAPDDISLCAHGRWSPDWVVPGGSGCFTAWVSGSCSGQPWLAVVRMPASSSLWIRWRRRSTATGSERPTGLGTDAASSASSRATSFELIALM